jgi:hypothetical protein
MGVPRGAVIGLIVCFLGLFAVVLFLFFDNRALEQERQDRQKQVSAAFLTNCMNREHEVAIIFRRLGLPPTGVRCAELPVFKH